MRPVPIEQRSPHPAKADFSDLMTPPESAKYRKISESCQNKERIRGDGPPYIKIRGRLIRYKKSDVDTWLAERVCRSTSESHR
jgi:predicted DNA-binding transcriptional regulator AlpA